MAEQTTTTLQVTTGNEIGTAGKIIAGSLFTIFTILAILTLIAFWPDRFPKEDETAIYRNKLFNVCLIDSLNPCDSCYETPKRPDSSFISDLVDSLIKPKDSTTLDSAAVIARRGNLSDSLFKVYTQTQFKNSCCKNTIKLNTLLLILVAVAGFLGTMIHTASSFTNYVGSEKFKKSWRLWYIVKPWTGAGLAVIIYFIFRAGLLNFNDTSNINLYGLITLAALAGLFTDKATIKLEEIFAVIFNPKDTRPDKINKDEVNVRITGIKPESLLGNIDNELIISGEGLDRSKFLIKIDDEEIKNPVIKGDSISFTYKLPEEPNKKEFMLKLYDEHGKEMYSSKLLRGDKPPQPQSTEPAGADTTKENDEKLNQEEFGDADSEDETNKPKE
jgi:hypothetical protein